MSDFEIAHHQDNWTDSARIIPTFTPQDLDLYCHDFCGCEPPDPSPCEHYQVFLDGWKEGAAQAEQVFEQQDLNLAEDLGRAAGFTSRRPPRHYDWVTPWRDGDGLWGAVERKTTRRFSVHEREHESSMRDLIFSA